MKLKYIISLLTPILKLVILTQSCFDAAQHVKLDVEDDSLFSTLSKIVHIKVETNNADSIRHG